VASEKSLSRKKEPTVPERFQPSRIRLKAAASDPRGDEAFSTTLRSKLQLLLYRNENPKEPASGRAEQRESFREYLYTLHTIIRASVPLMKEAESRCLPRTDPLKEALAKYYNIHSLEENGHDKWLLDDLEVIGMNSVEVLSRRPSVLVSEFVGSQYYWINHFHPVCLLGYIAVLEGYPPKKAQLENLMRWTVYPETAFRTLAKHSYLDQEHGRALDELLDALPLDEGLRELISLNAIYAAGKLTLILGRLQPRPA
jgi:hypothetical protein